MTGLLSLLAQMPGGGTIAYWAIWVIVACGIAAIVFAFIRHSGVAIPPIVVTVFWIIVAVVVCVAGVKLIMSIA